MTFFEWFRILRRIVRTYDHDVARAQASQQTLQMRLNNRLGDLDRILRERTELHADVGIRESTIIVIGRYRGGDYIRVHSVPEPTFDSVVEMLKREQKHATLHRIDAPRDFRAVIGRMLDP